MKAHLHLWELDLLTKLCTKGIEERFECVESKMYYSKEPLRRGALVDVKQGSVPKVRRFLNVEDGGEISLTFGSGDPEYP